MSDASQPPGAALMLATPRLTLRVHGLTDAAESAAMWADPEVTRHIGGRPSTRDASWLRLLTYAGTWSLLGYGYFVVRERATGRWVGEAGLADFHRDVVPSFDGVPEAGWALASWAHGRGYATEALRAVLGWADSHLRAPRTVCMISSQNAASIRVATKCGYRTVGETTFKGEATTIFERRLDGEGRTGDRGAPARM